MPGQKKRDAAVKEKLNPIRSMIEGKHVILIDDSIVRGTTTKQIINLIRTVGAKSVNVRISCPPVISACYMGIDFPTREELIAGRTQRLHGEKYIEEIRKTIGADSLLYNTIEDLINSIGLREDQLCLACLTGKYPIETIENLAEYENTIKMHR